VAIDRTKQRLPLTVRSQILAIVLLSSLPTLAIMTNGFRLPRFITAVFGLLSLAAALGLALSLAGRVELLRQIVVAGASGSIAYSRSLAGHDELALIAQTIDNLITRLQANALTQDNLTEWFQLVLAHCKAAIWQYDPATNLITGIGAPSHLPGSLGEQQIEYTAFLNAVHPADRAGLAQALEQGITQSQGFSYEYRLAMPHKQTHWYAMIGKTGCDKEGRLIITAIVTDITARRQAEHELQLLAKHDVGTLLYNRSYFEKELKRLDTYEQLPISVIMLDINGLKLINRRFNHAAGDHLMKQVAQLLTAVSGPNDVTARWGGDEFVMLLPKTDEQAVARKCDSILQQATNASSDPFPMSVALGYAVKEHPEQDLYDILSEAEARMSCRKLLDHHSAHSSIVSTLASTLRERSYETEEHARRLQQLSTALGYNLGLSSAQLDELSLAATLHDIGKVGVSDAILRKPGPLSDHEWQEMRNHVKIGYRIALCSPDLTPVAHAILYHHEWWNGQGYLEGLKGRSIPLIARILAIVDAFDAMTHDRPYRPRMSVAAACAELKRCAGTQFDAELVEKFIIMLSRSNPTQMPATSY
jgi:diguanylate cyclase (GGDEF)-like protein